MGRGRLWLTALSCWLAVSSCGDDGHGPQQLDAEPAETDDSGSDMADDSGTETQAENVSQTPPSGANGLAFDAEGRIWLADLFGNQVLRLDPESGAILDRFVLEGAGPDDVAIDQEGRVFWTGWMNGKVGRIDPATRENLIIAELPAGANSIAFSEDGRLFVGLVILNSGLYELDPEGHDAPRLVADNIGSLNGFDFGPDGFLWGPLDDAVAKIDAETGEIVETVAEGAYASVRYSERDGALYALTNGEDSAPPALNRIALDGYTVTRLGEPALAAVDNFAIAPGGDFVVSGFGVPELVVVSREDGTSSSVTKIGETTD